GADAINPIAASITSKVLLIMRGPKGGTTPFCAYGAERGRTSFRRKARRSCCAGNAGYADEQIVVGLYGHAPIEPPRDAARVVSHGPGGLRVVVQRGKLLGQVVGAAGIGDQPAAVLGGDGRRFTARIDRGDVRPAGGED